MALQAEPDWPAHLPEVRPWRQRSRSGTAADRMLTEVVTMRPPFIRHCDVRLSRDLVTEMEACVMGGR